MQERNLTDTTFLCVAEREIDKGVDLCSLLLIVPKCAFSVKLSTYKVLQSNVSPLLRPEKEWHCVTRGRQLWLGADRCRNVEIIGENTECYFSKVGCQYWQVCVCWTHDGHQIPHTLVTKTLIFDMRFGNFKTSHWIFQLKQERKSNGR